MLKFACGQNFVLFGHSGHELQRFENLVLVNLYGIVAAVICLHCSGIFHTNMYSILSIVKTKSLKRCNSCLESKFSQQTNLSMKIAILGSISAENEDKRSIKITLEIMLHVTKYARQYVFNLLLIMKANLYKFSIVLRKCNYRDSSQIHI